MATIFERKLYDTRVIFIIFKSPVHTKLVPRFFLISVISGQVIFVTSQ